MIEKLIFKSGFLFLQMLNNQKKLLKHLEEVEQKAGEIITDRQEIVALDKKRNDDRVGMRALQKQKHDKTWLTVGPILIKMSAKAAEESLVRGSCFANLILEN